MIKAVIFDLDGTLLDTLADLHEALNFALMKNNLAPITLEMTRSYLGNGIKSLVTKAISDNADKLQEVYTDFNEYYSTHLTIKSKPYENMFKLLDFLTANKIKLAVLSNKKEVYLKEIVEFFFSGYFLNVLGDKEGRKRKPDPTTLLTLIANLGVKTDEVLYVGDSEVDIETCLNASVLGAFVTYGFRKKSELRCYKNINLFDSVSDLKAFIENHI